jgi:hypothetical protein
VYEYRSVLERAGSNFAPLDLELDSILRRRDRKRRNQRIAAGVVGIAVFVAAVWIVTSGLSLDRSEKSVAPAGEVTGPAETAPPPPLASGAPDVVEQRTCSDGAGSRLELTNITDRDFPGEERTLDLIRMRFEVHRSPVGHSWRIVLHVRVPGFLTPNPTIRRTKVADDSGDIAIQVRRWLRQEVGASEVQAEARDTQTGEVCRLEAEI